MADSASITSNVADGASISSNLTDGVSITTNVTEGAAITADVTTGARGATGAGVPTGGTSGQFLVKNSSTDYDTHWVSSSASGINRSISVISSNTSAGSTTATDYVYLVSGTTTLTLPTAVGNTNRYSVTNVGSNTVTVATTSSQTINGSSTATLPIAKMSLDFISNGSNWVVE